MNFDDLITVVFIVVWITPFIFMDLRRLNLKEFIYKGVNLKYTTLYKFSDESIYTDKICLIITIGR